MGEGGEHEVPVEQEGRVVCAGGRGVHQFGDDLLLEGLLSALCSLSQILTVQLRKEGGATH